MDLTPAQREGLRRGARKPGALVYSGGSRTGTRVTRATQRRLAELGLMDPASYALTEAGWLVARGQR